jgi:uncharacterized membrane protein YfcA
MRRLRVRPARQRPRLSFAIGVVAVDELFGFVGLIVAVPILATIKILLEELWTGPIEQASASALVPAPGEASNGAASLLARLGHRRADPRPDAG